MTESFIVLNGQHVFIILHGEVRGVRKIHVSKSGNLWALRKRGPARKDFRKINMVNPVEPGNRPFLPQLVLSEDSALAGTESEALKRAREQESLLSHNWTPGPQKT